jgi:long-chain-acyl-CoA dehydrogenase
MERDLYDEEHEAFRTTVRTFVEREVLENIERWETERAIGRDTWLAAGSQGIIGLGGPEEYGGAGLHDYRFRNIVLEELARVGANSLSSSFSLQDDVVAPYFIELSSQAQRERWLADIIAGRSITAIAITEPGTGSDMRAISTKADKVAGGWVVSGSKTFISSGVQSDLVVVVARTGEAGSTNGFSLLVVEDGTEGFVRGRKLRKMGLHGQDTAEMSFDGAFVPDENLLGEEGGALRSLMKNLAMERISIAATAVAGADAAFAWTLEYVDQRHAFGKPIADFQSVRHTLAEISAELDVTRAYVDKAVRALEHGALTPVEAAKAKMWASDMSNRVIDRMLQMFGGYGYMVEYPIARAYQDARVQKIFGGTNEIMKEIIGRDLIGRR